MAKGFYGACEIFGIMKREITLLVGASTTLTASTQNARAANSRDVKEKCSRDCRRVHADRKGTMQAQEREHEEANMHMGNDNSRRESFAYEW